MNEFAKKSEIKFCSKNFQQKSIFTFKILISIFWANYMVQLSADKKDSFFRNLRSSNRFLNNKKLLIFQKDPIIFLP